MDVRASSTALDTVLFVLLVGVAVGVLAGVDGRPEGGADRVAEETADVLATGTTEVTYDRTATVTTTSLLGGNESRTITVERSVHGTRAELLAAAAVADPALDGESLAGTGGDLRTRVRTATRRVLATRTANVQVGVTWRPYPDAPLRSGFTVGDAPPSDADVSTVTAAAASGFPNVSAAALRAAEDDGYEGVATVVARAAVDGLFPRSETTDSLYSEGPDRVLTAHRYRRASSVLGADTDEALARRDVDAANRRLADALAGRLRPDLRQRFDSPRAAARTASVDRVRIVVRTWSP